MSLLDIAVALLAGLAGQVIGYGQGRLAEVRAHHRKWMERNGIKPVR